MWTSPHRGITLNARVILSRFTLLALVFLFGGLLTPAEAQSGPIALVRHASKDAGTTTSSTLAFPANNTAGNWIGVVVRAGALNEVVTVSDTSHNVYQKAFQFNQTTDGFTFAIFYAESIAGGTNTVTVSQSISGTLRIAILEYSGVAAAGSLDVIATAQGHSTAPSSAPAVSTTANGDLLLGAVMTGNPQNATAGSGYTIEESVPTIPNSKLIVEDQIQPVAGATLANATISSADDWAAGFAAFKVSNGSGGSPNISGLNPTSGAVSTPVVISGTNFGGTQGTSTVKFNGTLAVPTAWSATSITAPVPSGATTGNVVVNVGGTNSNGVTFTVNTPPSVTINQAAGQADPTSASPINFTAVFSGAVTGFATGDVTLGGTAGATTAVVTGSGTTYNVAVSGMTQSGTVTASIPAGVATANGLTNTASTSTDNTVTFNTPVAPSVTINQAASQADPTSASPINFTAVFSTTVTGFTSTDVTLGGTAGATTAVVSGSGPSYNVAVSGMTQSGTVTASIPAGVVTANGVGNTASTSTDNTVTFNFSVPPTITTLNPNTGPVGTSVTITGTNFGTSQGTSTVTFNGVSSTPTNWSATSITAPVPIGLAPGPVPVVVTVNGTASNGMTFTVTGSGAGIALVQHTSKDAGTGASSALAFNTNNTAGNFIAVAVRAGALNEAVTVADTNHNTYQRAIQLNQTTDGFTFAIYYAENIASGTNTVTVSQSISGTLRFAILEYSGVATAGSLDAVASTQGHSAGPSSGASVSTTASGDLLLGSVMTGNSGAFTAGSGYQIEQNTPAEPGTKLMVEDQIQGAAGPASASATLGAVDDWATGMAAFKAGGGVVVPPPAITGLSPGSGGVGSSVVITGTNFGSPQGASTVKFNGVTATATAWSATSITATVPTGATTGNVVVNVSGVASNGVSFTVTAQPSVSINQAAAQADPTKNSPINFTAVFSAAVTGFTNAGVTLGGTAGATTVAVTGGPSTYNVAVSGMTQSGTVTASIPAGVATGNGSTNTASTSTDNTVTYDITPPTVTINQAASQVDPTGASPINFAVVFSEPVTSFTNLAVTLGGTAGATTAAVTGSGPSYNVAVSGMTQSGTVTASIGAAKVTDVAGNPNTASTSTDDSVTYNALSGLVASYSFSEGMGTTTADSSGNNNNGTLTGGVTWATGQVGNAISFNGSSGNVTVNDSASLDLNGSFTLSGWVKPATIAGTQTVLIKETTSGCGYFWQIVNGQIDSGFNNGSGCVEHVATTATLSAGTWYFVVVTLDHSSNTYNTYLNGSLLATTTETGVPVPNTQALVMGQSGDSAGGFERYNGVLDEVKIYNRALSLSEVQQQYNTGLGAPTISGLNPTSGPIGTSVVISGANFGTTQSSSTVKFNGVTAIPTAWSATSITAPVPNGATTGNVVVTVGGVASNGMTFTIASTSLNVTISPKRAAVTLSQPQQFTGTVNNDPLNGGITWSVDGVNSGTATSGTVSASGLYTPGTQPGPHTVTATSNSNTSVSASASVAVTDLPGVFTYHNDNARTGQNVQEYALTTSTVNSSTFGALFTCGGLDGYLYAAPLYYANLNVGGVTRNVVFVATEHDSVYAFDADSPACVQLWKTSFIAPPNVVPVAPADVDELSDLTPEIGITSTPVIDSTSHTIYVMAKTKEFVGTVSGVACTSSAPCFVHRLHALSVTDGTEKVNSPVVVTAPNFNPLTHLQRAGLLFNNGVVYVPIGSHGDNGVWQGWMMAYNATSLVQLWSYHTSDPINGNNGGAIWGSGNAPAVDASGNIYFETGNGNYDGVNNWADSVIKLTPGGVKADSFTPFDQAIMQQNDIDLGSSNPIILPDSVGSAAHPHLMIAMGKVGVIYLLDQTNMGGFNAAANQDVGEVSITFNTSSAIKGFFGQPAYWNGNIYEVVVGDVLRQLPISNGSIAGSSVSQSSNTFSYRAGTPVVSASGTTNGIVWNLDAVGYKTSTPVVLYAYDATNLGTMLFTSPASGAGAAPISVKFPVPTVANGKVYVGGQLAFTVYGLLPN